MMAMHEELPEKLIENIVTLPTIPAMLAELNTAIANPDSSASDIAKIISRDPSTATKVLRLANSAYYGLRNKVTTVNHAVTMLGFNIIRNLVITATVFDVTFNQNFAGIFDRDKFWRHSLGTALAARILAQQAFRADRRNDDFFICGLLHDLGKIIFGQHLQQQFQQALQASVRQAIPLAEAEREAIGCTHADVGGLLAKRWNLSNEVISALSHHHQPLKASNPFRNHAAVVHVADFMVRKKEIGSGGGSDPLFDRFAWDLLQITKRSIPDILSEIDNLLDSEGLELSESDVA